MRDCLGLPRDCWGCERLFGGYQGIVGVGERLFGWYQGIVGVYNKIKI